MSPLLYRLSYGPFCIFVFDSSLSQAMASFNLEFARVGKKGVTLDAVFVVSQFNLFFQVPVFGGNLFWLQLSCHALNFHYRPV